MKSAPSAAPNRIECCFKGVPSSGQNRPHGKSAAIFGVIPFFVIIVRILRDGR
jgi:hypothetical protein